MELKGQVSKQTTLGVIKNPDSCKGEVIPLGGTIVKWKTPKGCTLIEVSQKPVHRRGKPYAMDILQWVSHSLPRLFRCGDL